MPVPFAFAWLNAFQAAVRYSHNSGDDNNNGCGCDGNNNNNGNGCGESNSGRHRQQSTLAAKKTTLVEATVAMTTMTMVVRGGNDGDSGNERSAQSA